MLSFLILYFASLVLAYTPVPRWGQAIVVVEDALFVYGGKVDQYNEQYYTSSPNTNDLLYLPLSNGFQVSNPPWELVSSSSNTSTSQGPALSWHTLSAVSTSTVLLFGGQPGPNSPVVIADNADSGQLLNIADHMNPSWLSQPRGWAAEPIRRVYHSTVTLPDGRVLIIGGTKADGSGLAFPQNYVFDATKPSFTPLDLEGGPVNLFGHASLILPDGRVVVLGGVSVEGGVSIGPAASLATIWVLDTSQSTWSWNAVTVPSGPIPTGRRAFAAVALSNGRILIQGGADRVVQTTYSDGWVLDLSLNPPTWTRILALDEIGLRHDHFAVAYGQQVIFGFGYGPYAPFPVDLKVYDVANNDFPVVFTPPPPPSPSSPTTHGTLPGASPTGSRPPVGSHNPTLVPTPKPGEPGGGDNGADDGKNHIKIIAICLALGILGLVVIAMVMLHRRRKKRREEEQRGLFSMLTDNNDENPWSTRDLPPAAGYHEKAGVVDGVLASIGLRGKAIPSYSQRQNMLADEDTRQFDWSPYGLRKVDTGSSWSLKNLLSGVRGKTREPSSGRTSVIDPAWREKQDPFLGESETVLNEKTGYADIGGLGSGGSRTWGSYATYRNEARYVDPFSDTELPRLDIQTLPVPFSSTYHAAEEGHVLTPLTDQDSMPSQSVSSLSHAASNMTSATSYSSETLRRPSSIIDANPGGKLVNRSNSLWARFTNTSLLSRHNSLSPKSHPVDIRDPHPAPRLRAIEETRPPPDDSSQSTRTGVGGKDDSASIQKTNFSGGKHAKSLSSIQTSQTANSEALERMAGMEVVQRMGSGSHRTTSSLGSSNLAESVTEDLLDINRYESPVELTQDLLPLGSAATSSVSYPTAQETSSSFANNPPEPSIQPSKPTPDRLRSASLVASRIAEFERRSSPQDETPSSPKRADDRSRKKTVTVGYGLAPKPNLFVANPDHAASPFED